MSYLKELHDVISAWPKITYHSHRFGGREYRFGAVELGHVHTGGVVNIPFPRAIRDELLAERLAEQHHFVPDSGWITFRMRDEQGLRHATWLMRLSYLRYALKSVDDPHRFLEHESETLGLNPRFRSLLEKFVPSRQETTV
jgi:hypothetical protein